MIEDVDEMGTAFGKWMRFHPNGWPSKNHIIKLKKILYASGNSYAPAAITSDALNTLGQNSYHPQNLWSGELKLDADRWQISASGTSADAYGALSKNPSGGRINNIRYHRSKPLIKISMPEDALKFRRGLEDLPECHQIMLWVHHVLVVVSPSKLKKLREQGKLTCYEVTHQQRLDLLQTTNDIYPKWLGLSRRAIGSEIERHDAVSNFKKVPPRPKSIQNESVTAPLWSCRIFASTHKFPIAHTYVNNILPVSFSRQGFPNPRTTADFLPTDEAFDNGDNVFRLASGEVYVAISNREYGRLYQQGKASSFLAERRANAADFTFCDFDEWHPVIWHPGWIKPVPHYNVPSLMKKRGLTRLDECAYCWGQELLHEEKHLWERGGRELGWYL